MVQAAAISVQNTVNPSVSPIGLTSAEASRRLCEIGPNAVSEEAPPRWRRFLAKFSAPIPWMLEAAIVLQIGLGAYVEAAVIGGLLLFNATLGFIQEDRAGAVLATLKMRLAPTALVRRDGEWAKIPAAELVPGDVVSLALGALVPADAHIVSGLLWKLTALWVIRGLATQRRSPMSGPDEARECRQNRLNRPAPRR